MELQQFIGIPLFFTFLLLVLNLVNQRKKSHIQSKNPPLPPGPSKLPIIGHLHHLRGMPHHSLKNLAKIHGPIMYIKVCELPFLVVSSSDMAEQVLKTNDLMFVDRVSSIASKIFSYGCTDLALSPYGEYWRQIRKICVLEFFSAKRVQSFWSIRDLEVSNLIGKLSLKDGDPINFSQESFMLISDITFKIVFGPTCKHNGEFISLLEELIELAATSSIQDFFPSLKFIARISGFKSNLEKVFLKTDTLLANIIREYQMEKDEKSLQGSVLGALLRIQEAGELKVPLTIENLKAILVDLFLAGVDTTSAILTWTFSELLRNPRVMNKAQAEVRQIFSGKESIDQEDVDKLNYLELIIKETLRLHPPSPLLLPRESRESCEIEGYQIPKGTKVFVNAWAINRDPENWADPESFKPERFKEKDIDYNGTNFKYIPFGSGRRMCPGISFGTANLALPLAKLLYHFDWELANGANPEELDMTEETATALRRKNDLYVTPRVYNHGRSG